MPQCPTLFSAAFACSKWLIFVICTSLGALWRSRFLFDSAPLFHFVFALTLFYYFSSLRVSLGILSSSLLGILLFPSPFSLTFLHICISLALLSPSPFYPSPFPPSSLFFSLPFLRSPACGILLSSLPLHLPVLSSCPPLWTSLGILSGSSLGSLLLPSPTSNSDSAFPPFLFLPPAWAYCPARSLDLLSSLGPSLYPSLLSLFRYLSSWRLFLLILKNGYLFRTPIKQFTLDKSVGTLGMRITAYPPLWLTKATLALLMQKETPLTVLWLPFPNGTFLPSRVIPFLFHGDLSGLGILFWKHLGLTKTPTPPTPLIPGSTPLNFMITKRKSMHSFQGKLKITKIMSL